MERVLPSEQVGAKELVLRSFVIGRRAEAHGAQMTASIKVPPPVGSRRITLEVFDHRDKGYSLHAVIRCAAPGTCSRNWAAATLGRLGLAAKDLSVAARSIDTASADETLVPACLCKPSALTGRMPVILSFMPSRALNIRYSIYTDAGEMLERRSLNNQPAGLPVVIPVGPKGAQQSRLKLIIDHVAAAGGSVERFSDRYYFYQT